MESRIAGKLKPNEYDHDLFESEEIEIPYFDNQKLRVGFHEALHKPYLDAADSALENFLGLDRSVREKDSELVAKYYNETLQFGYTKILDISSTIDIWKFVTPTEITIDCDERGIFYLCVSCGCEWEEEHGLQLVFKMTIN